MSAAATVTNGTNSPDLAIARARSDETDTVLRVLHEAARWLADTGRPLWSDAEIGRERIERDVAAGRYYIARDGTANGDGGIAGVMRLDLEDPAFWPEIAPGSAVFLHKLAVARRWSGRGVSTRLLDFALTHARELGRSHLRLDCVATRAELRRLYENHGFALHSELRNAFGSFARYELPTGR